MKPKAAMGPALVATMVMLATATQLAAAAFLCGAWMGLMYRGGSAAVLAPATGALTAATGLIALTLVQRHGHPALTLPALPDSFKPRGSP